MLAGTVVGAPGADNLKIRPEFSPGRSESHQCGADDKQAISGKTESMSRLSLVYLSALCDARQLLFAGTKRNQKCLWVLWGCPGWL